LISLHIPFNRPFISGKEYEFIQQAIAGWKLSGDGAFTQKCHALLESELGIHKALLTTSCTHALEMSALLLELKPGDEVIIPSFTFVSTVNAFVLAGAQPVFVDIRADTLNLDDSKLEGLITPRTRAIVVVHYAGVACEMDTILQIANRHGIAVVEDNAHGLFGKYKGRYLGTLGCLATQSFHETKNFTCGEGGALLINDPQFVERAEIIREKGTNRSRFFRGQVDKYTWMDIGSSYLPSDLLAAFLFAQLEARESIQAKRRRIWEYYNNHLSDWAVDQGIQLPSVPQHCEQPFHMYYLVVPTLEQRERLISYLNGADINSVFHYLPLHLSRMGRKFGGKEGQCPVAESISDRLVRLPFYTGMTENDQSRVVSALREFRFTELSTPMVHAGAVPGSEMS
jgi:dTDP-4-amino-4,6-dideoxygalactose transaminase